MNENSEGGNDGKIPLGSIVGEARVYALEDGWNALDVLCLMKCLDESGEILWAWRATAGLNREELLGVLRVQSAILERELIREFDADAE